MSRHVVVLPGDTSACGYYRLRLPAGAVQQVRPDWDVKVFHPGHVKVAVGADGALWQVQGIPDPKTVDLFVVQRLATRAQVELVRWLRQQGAAVVLDVDDAMWAIHPENSAYPAWNDTSPTGCHWRHLGFAAEEADLVTVTTDALARRYGKHGRVEVLPNCVPGDLPQHLQSVRDTLDATPTVGWAGFTATHPQDLRVVGDAVRRAQEDTGCLLRVVGDAAGAAADWGVPADAVDTVAPVLTGLPYYTALTTLDIGLVPLADTLFNRAKSYLKALEYSAVGLPVVASDTPANRLLAKTVDILLASTPQQWYDHITFLLQHPETARGMGAMAQAQVFAQHTYEANAEAWASTWERAMARRAAMV